MILCFRCSKFAPDNVVKYQCGDNNWNLISINNDTSSNSIEDTIETLDKELDCNADPFELDPDSFNQAQSGS